MRSEIRFGVATVAFALLHSALATRTAKREAGKRFGERPAGALFRSAYNLQALLTFGALVAYGYRTPTRTLYELRGAAALACRTAQLAGLLHALWAAREVGVARLAGVDSLWAWLRDRPLPAGPAAQGPERREDGRLSTGGPFRWSRHPLNLSPVPVFWLTPRMTTRRLTFNLVSTAYLVLGSWHEERRLLAEYGDAYAAYLRSGVPFFLPRVPIRLRP